MATSADAVPNATPYSDRVVRSVDTMMEAICTVKLPGRPPVVEQALSLLLVAAYIMKTYLLKPHADGQATADIINAELTRLGVSWRLVRWQ